MGGKKKQTRGETRPKCHSKEHSDMKGEKKKQGSVNHSFKIAGKLRQGKKHSALQRLRQKDEITCVRSG